MFILEVGLVIPPKDNDLSRLDVVDQAGIRIEPLGFPLVVPDVFQKLNPLERGTGKAMFADSVLLAKDNVCFLHSDTRRESYLKTREATSQGEA